MFYYIAGAVVVLVLYNLLTGRYADYKKKFTDKVVIIVGASSGLGEEMAVQVSTYKPNLVLVARRLEKLKEVEEKCKSRGAKSVISVQADVTSQADCKRIIDTAIEHYKQIDVLFLNAGIALTSSLFKMTDPEPIKRVIDTDLFGSIYPAFYALPHLRKSAGHITVTSSGYGKIPGLGISAYSASKHALHGFFDCLRAEETRNRIKVTLACPGYIKTAIHDRALGGDGKEVGSHKKSAMFGYTETSLPLAAKKILQATAANKTEIYFPTLVSIGVRLRGLLGPGIYDWLNYGSK
jgi:short-subunit dehydrogenase